MTDAQAQALRDLQHEVALLLWEEKSEAHQWALNLIHDFINQQLRPNGHHH